MLGHNVMKKVTKAAPVFEFRDSGKKDGKEIVYDLYIDGVSDNVKFNNHKKNYGYWVKGTIYDAIFLDKIGIMKCDVFPEKIYLNLPQFQESFYKKFGYGNNVFMRRKGNCIEWWISFDMEIGMDIFDWENERGFFEEFMKTAAKYNYPFTQPDITLSVECLLPIIKGQTIRESFVAFQKLVSKALYQTDKRMTDDMMKKLLKYQKSIVTPSWK